MENHNRLKLKIFRLLRSSSCGSCNTRATSDVVARPEHLPHSHHQFQPIDLFSPNPHPLPSIFRPKTELFPSPKVPFPTPLPTPQNNNGRECPPASPMSPFNTFREFQQPDWKPKRKKSRKKRSRAKITQFLKRANSDNYYDDSEAEEDEDDYDDEKTTLFSSVSLSSDSSESFGFGRNRVSYEVNGPVKGGCEMGLVAPLQGKVKDSFVVKKRSSDPYDDFRASMVEMIIERQIFGANDLEDLLRTFLSLNSYHHHRVIVQVYTEIWDALFSTFS